MTSRLPLRPEIIAIESVGWTRKTCAIAMHLSCLALFALVVVWPVVSPIANGELAREFKPWVQAWTAWTQKLGSLQP